MPSTAVKAKLNLQGDAPVRWPIWSVTLGFMIDMSSPWLLNQQTSLAGDRPSGVCGWVSPLETYDFLPNSMLVWLAGSTPNADNRVQPDIFYDFDA